MAFLDFVSKAVSTAADIAASDRMQKNVEKGYQNGHVSQEDYDRYHEALEKHKARRQKENEC